MFTDFNEKAWGGGSTPPYLQFYTGPTNWAVLHEMLMPFKNAPQVMKMMGIHTPVISTKDILANDCSLDVLFRSHASVKKGVTQIGDITDHECRPNTSALPAIFSMPANTSNVFIFSLNESAGKLQHALVAHYGIGEAVGRGEAEKLLRDALGPNAEHIGLFDREELGCFKDMSGRLCLSDSRVTKEIMLPPRSTPLPRPPQP